MRLEFTIAINLPDEGLTEEQQKTFCESVLADIKALNYGMTKGVLGAAYDRVMKSKKKTNVISPYESIKIIQ